MLETFLARFVALVDTLRAHPRVRVTHVWRGAPATEVELSALAAAWGHPVPAALRTLYRQANGAQLRWVDTGDEMYEPARDDRTRFDGPWERLFETPGVSAGYLDIPPLDDLASRDTIGAMFGSVREEFLHRAVAFDSFSESEDAVIVFGDGRDDPLIALSSDYLADVDAPGERTLSQYLDRVLATWASTEHRRKDAPRSLDGLLRQRIALEPERLVGQRVVYVDECRGHALMRGRVVSTITLPRSPPGWWFGPIVIEVIDDLNETIYVPLRALFPPDAADDYEALHADPEALRRLLLGPAEPMFDALASVSPLTHEDVLIDGPAIGNHAWPHAALTSRLPPAEATRALIVAAETLQSDPHTRTERAVVWPATRPPLRGGQRTTMGTLAAGLFDAAALHVGRVAPDDLPGWLGKDATTVLGRMLRRCHAQNPLRGYDPLTDPHRTEAFFFDALQGGPTVLDIVARSSRHGGELGLARHRVVEG